MSYRLIAKFNLTIVSAAAVTTTRVVDVRAYPQPKRDTVGTVEFDGKTVGYRRTGGKGRGTADHRYVYAMLGAESAYWEITEAEGTAMVGGTVTMTRVAHAVVDAPEVAEPAAEPAAEHEPSQPAADQVLADEYEPTKALRRVRGGKKVVA